MKKNYFGTSLTGYNNDNYLLDTGIGQIMIRIPVITKHETDIQMLSEGRVLRFLQNYDLNIPQVLFFDEKNRVLLEEYIDGDTLDTKYSVETEIPETVLSEIAGLMGKLHSINISEFPDPIDTVTFSVRSFYEFVHNQIKETCGNLYTKASDLYGAMNIKKEDLDAFFLISPTVLNERQPCLCHCDVHRKNLLLDKKKQLWLLDWELALIGDPLYDLAIHFQKMRYSDEEKIMYLKYYGEVHEIDDSHTTMDQIEIYRLMEAVKYAMVDIQHVIAQAREGRIDNTMIKRYYRKLCYAYEALHVDNRISIQELQKIIERQK